MAKATDSVSRPFVALARVWMQPHRTESFTLPRGPHFIQKVRHIARLYLDPADHGPPVRRDKSQIQASSTAPSPGHNSGHERCGVQSAPIGVRYITTPEAANHVQTGFRAGIPPKVITCDT